MTSLKTKNESSGGGGGRNSSLANPPPSFPLLLPCIDNAFRQMAIPFLLLPSFTVELHSFITTRFFYYVILSYPFFIPLFSTFLNFFERFDSKMFFSVLVSVGYKFQTPQKQKSNTYKTME
jgi:hypothetical protein